MVLNHFQHSGIAMKPLWIRAVLRLLENFSIKDGQSVQFIKTRLQNKQTNESMLPLARDTTSPVRGVTISVLANRGSILIYNIMCEVFRISLSRDPCIQSVSPTSTNNKHNQLIQNLYGSTLSRVCS